MHQVIVSLLIILSMSWKSVAYPFSERYLSMICEGHYHNEWWDWQYGPACLPDKSGWYDFDCKEHYDEDAEFWYTYSGTIVKHACPKGSYCICKKDTKCVPNELCFRPLKEIPDFVDVGVLSYTGQEVADDGWDKSTNKMRGLSIKDQVGRFYSVNTRYDWNKRRFVEGYKIIIPKPDGGYFEYSGTFNGDYCSIKNVSKTEKLFGIEGLKEFELKTDRTSIGGKKEQQWFKRHNYREGHEKITWDLIYDKGTNKAYPKHYHSYELDNGEADYNRDKSYTYQPNVEENHFKWFEFSKYCNPPVQDMTKIKDGQPGICNFPFEYKGKIFTKCTKFDASKNWCALDASYDKRWIYCE